MCHAQLRISFEADYVVAMVRKVFAGRVDLPRRRRRDRAGRHRASHRRPRDGPAVRARRRPGAATVVLAADAAHLYAHIDGGRVFPIIYNLAEVLEGYETLKKLATSREHIVPGHDPVVLKRYPAAKPGLEGWIVRLDVDPKTG